MSFLHVITEGTADEIVCGPHETVAQARDCERDFFENAAAAENARAEYLAEQHYERWLEGGGSASDRISAEHAEDERRAAQWL